MKPSLHRAADAASDSTVVQLGARLGYAVTGLVHLLIAWIAAQVAFGSGGGKADQSGALATLAQQPFGAVLLWIAVAAFALLALWQVTDAVTSRETGEQVKAVAKAVLYVSLAWTSLTFASGGRSSSSKQTKDFTATLMQQPGGRFIVGVVGLGVIGVGCYHIYKGWKRKFLEDLREHPGRWVVVAGRIGYIAKGVALIVVGGLFLVAAAKHQPGKSTGLDGALRTMREAPAGTALLLAIAAGIAAYGVYSFMRARYARV